MTCSFIFKPLVIEILALKSLSVRRENSRVGFLRDSVNLAMSNNTKAIQEQSNMTTRILCKEIKFSK